MESGDGLIVRVRLHAGRLSVDTAVKLAEAATQFGNGEIDLTRRANLQLRGVTPGTLGPLQNVLDALALLDPSAEAEAIRNIIVSPLAGIDPTAHMDTTALALELEARLAAEPRLWHLPPKFGFIIDGGGMLPLDRERADIRLAAVSADEIALGLDAPEVIRWLGSIATERAVEAATRLALAYLATQPQGSRLRISEISESARAKVINEIASKLRPLAGLPPSRPRGRALGVLEHEGLPYAVGVGVPFGRVSAQMFDELARAADAVGARAVRVSPWRSFFIEVSDAHDASELSSAAQRLGFIMDTGDPMFRIEACTGLPACRSASFDTRAVARKIASLPHAGELGFLHISGCTKGCACSKPRPWVLVGVGDRLGVVRNGRADDVPVRLLPAADIERLLEMLEQDIGP
jgi:precorrin-3B synthase